MYTSNTHQQCQYRFLDPKFKTFSKNNSSFFQTSRHQIGDNEDLENRRNQAFFMVHCKRTVTKVQCRCKRIMKLLILRLNVMAKGEIEQDLTTAKKIHLSSTHCSFEKTKQKQTKAPAFFLFSTLFLVLKKSIKYSTE